MRATRLLIFILLLVAAGLVVSDRFGCISPAHGRSTSAVKAIDEPVRVILEPAYLSESFGQSIYWNRDPSLEINLVVYSLKFQTNSRYMAVAIVADLDSKTALELAAGGWEMVSAGELLAFAINYPDKLMQYGRLGVWSATGPCAKVWAQYVGGVSGRVWVYDFSEDRSCKVADLHLTVVARMNDPAAE
jgi:hypothetical protein